MKKLFKRVDPIYEVYEMPKGLDTYVSGTYFLPEGDYPSFLDYVDFIVDEAGGEIYVDYKDKRILLKSGMILVWNIVLEQIEEICENKEEFKERFF